MKRIIYKNTNGNVAVMCVSPEYLLTNSMEDCAAKDVPEGIEFHIVDTDSLPFEHNDFFNAWELSDGLVTVNHAKSQDITKARLRVDREAALVALDIRVQRALEDGSDTKSIIAEKQRLRDITKLADKAKTLQELKSLTIKAAN